MKKKKQKQGQKIVRQLVPKAAVALKNEFYLESAMIISSLVESRLKNLITRVEKVNPGIGFGLERCIKRVKYLILRNPDSLIAKSFEVRLIDDLREWKNHRNGILKDMIEIHVSRNRLKKLAQEGIILFQELNASGKKFKKEWKKELIGNYDSTPAPDETTTEG
jgi:hypothetical protein